MNIGKSGQDCLIGSTGFVGGSLARQHNFMGHFTSRNIASISETNWDTVVCAAAPGSMLEANTAPDRDARKIGALCDELRKLRARRFVLVSSVAVLEDFAGQDDESTIHFQQELAYGRNRRMLEAFCQENFDQCLVLRLPALYGPDLRKNFVFDLMNPMPSMLNEVRMTALKDNLSPAQADFLDTVYHPDAATGLQKLDRPAYNAAPQRAKLDAAVLELGLSATQFHNPNTTYQFYGTMRLWQDIGVASEAGLEVIHLATAPLRAADIHLRLTGCEMPETGARLHHEDLRSRHASLWGRQDGYLQSADEVMNALAAFYVG